MPEQDTDVLEVLIRQVAECRNADPIFSKAFCILPETELLKPLRNLLHRGSAPDYRASPARIGKVYLTNRQRSRQHIPRGGA
jgi:hypothetical protein